MVDERPTVSEHQGSRRRSRHSGLSIEPTSVVSPGLDEFRLKLRLTGGHAQAKLARKLVNEPFNGGRQDAAIFTKLEGASKNSVSERSV
jgi:hypothetical protein